MKPPVDTSDIHFIGDQDDLSAQKPCFITQTSLRQILGACGVETLLDLAACSAEAVPDAQNATDE